MNATNKSMNLLKAALRLNSSEFPIRMGSHLQLIPTVLTTLLSLQANDVYSQDLLVLNCEVRATSTFSNGSTNITTGTAQIEILEIPSQKFKSIIVSSEIDDVHNTSLTTRPLPYTKEITDFTTPNKWDITTVNDRGSNGPIKEVYIRVAIDRVDGGLMIDRSYTYTDGRVTALKAVGTCKKRAATKNKF